jgi:hypothetical protein
MTADFLTAEETALFTPDEVGSIAVWVLCESHDAWQDGYDLERAAAEHVRPEVFVQIIATVRRLVAEAAAINTAKRYVVAAPEHETPRFEGDTVCCGSRHRVLRDGREVASIFEHPHTYGGRTHVSMRAITWAGKQPEGSGPGGDGQMFYDFVSKTATTAAETLPEVIRKCERIIAWRERLDVIARKFDEASESPRVGESDRTEPFCACGRVVSLCDGSRRGCNSRSAS